MQLIEYLAPGGYFLTINGKYPVLEVTERGI